MNIVISPNAFVTHYLNDFKPDVVISIVDPDDEHPIELPEKSLKIKFRDISFEPKSEYDVQRFNPPTQEIVRDILKFSEENIDQNSKILVHCFAGISRSSAAAIIVLTTIFSWREAVEIVAHMNTKTSKGLIKFGYSYFSPNSLMIFYLDKILYADGLLVRQVESTFNY